MVHAGSLLLRARKRVGGDFGTGAPAQQPWPILCPAHMETTVAPQIVAAAATPVLEIQVKSLSAQQVVNRFLSVQ